MDVRLDEQERKMGLESYAEGQVAVVTGGSSGIGLATAGLFLDSGAAVAICGRDPDRLAAAEDTLRQRHPEAPLLGCCCDVLDAEAVERFAQAVAARYGRIDILINNAGEGRSSTFSDTSDEAWRRELELKYFSIIRPVRAFLPWLKQSPSPSITCVNSLLALQPEPHMVATSSARAGTLNLIKSLATELAPLRIRVNAILVGIVESGQWHRRFRAQKEQPDWAEWSRALALQKGIPWGRLGHPDEAARALFFLASTMSSYTTGSTVDVSGGLARHV